MSKKTTGDDIWKNNVEKINSELFTLTYGSVVAQLCRDFQNNYIEVNNQLDKMGYNIGLRLIEEFLAKTGIRRCQTFKEHDLPSFDQFSTVGCIFKKILRIMVLANIMWSVTRGLTNGTVRL